MAVLDDILGLGQPGASDPLTGLAMVLDDIFGGSGQVPPVRPGQKMQSGQFMLPGNLKTSNIGEVGSSMPSLVPSSLSSQQTPPLVPDPSFLDRFSALIGAPNLGEGIRMATSGLDQQVDQARGTYGALLKRGVDPEMAKTIVSDRGMLKRVIPALFSRQFASGDYSKSPIMGTDEQGNPVLMQLGSSGDVNIPKLPEGVKVSKNPIRLDVGDRFILLDPVTRQPVGEVPKNLQEAAAQTAEGKARGEARVDLPKVRNTARRLIGQVDNVLSDPNLPNVTGWEANFPTTLSKNVTTEEKVAQLGGGAFLQAFQDLKGGGQITEVEGKKATDALARLTNMAQDDVGYRQALKDFRNEVVKLVKMAEQRAGIPDSTNQPSAPAMLDDSGGAGWGIKRVR